MRFQAEASVVRQLDLIGRSHKAGRLDRAEMLRTALDNFIATQLTDDSVREFVEQQLGTPALRLHKGQQAPGNSL